MSKIKIVLYLALAFIFYKGFVAFQNFEIGVDDRVADIEEKADFEKVDQAIQNKYTKPIIPDYECFDDYIDKGGYKALEEIKSPKPIF